MLWTAKSLLIVGLVVPIQVGAAELPEPAAFLPFKKVGQRRGLPRLQAAIPETMTRDLARNRVSTVSFADVRKVVDWQHLHNRREPYDIPTAIRLGEQLGARSVVLGTYETPGSNASLSARLIAVPSGKVLGSAQGSAPVDEIFRVQDEILAQLFADRFSAPKRPDHHLSAADDDGRNTFRAYRLYALGLTGSDTTRYGLMESALDEDPDLPYAIQALAQLEHETSRVAALAHQPFVTTDRELRRRLDPSGLNEKERHEAVMELCGMLEKTGYIRELAVIAERIHQIRWPDDPEINMRATGLYWVFKARQTLKQTDEALAVGQRYLEELSSARFHHVISGAVRKIKKEQTKRQEGRVGLREALAALETKRTRLEQERCGTLHNNLQYFRAIRACADFSTRHQGDNDTTVKQLVLQARWYQARALYETGRFTEAHELAKAIIAEDREQARRLGIEISIRAWPRD
ncbi:hypothetical protein ACFL6C_00455 [Myxococcota bacterium]